MRRDLRGSWGSSQVVESVGNIASNSDKYPRIPISNPLGLHLIYMSRSGKPEKSAFSLTNPASFHEGIGTRGILQLILSVRAFWLGFVRELGLANHSKP
jgi:hypothetical protein